VPRAPGAYARQFHAAYAGLRHDRASRSVVDAWHHDKVLVWVYTVNRMADIGRALSLGVDGVISDFPDRIPLQ
jgi:glycerophosphoryl diester phosphodiesterase